VPRPARSWEVIVVGAGPAGLSAALILGRCLRRVLVCDTGRPRNARAQALHGFLSRDGLPPLELLRIARAQLRRYRTVELRRAEVTNVRPRGGAFEVQVKGGAPLRADFVLLATGVVDHLPDVTGLRRYYGRGVFHCPYCDGWENRGLPLVVYGRGRKGAGLSQELLRWSRDVTLCTDGHPLERSYREELRGRGIEVYTQRIARLGGAKRLEHVELADGRRLPCRAVFLATGQHQRSPLAVGVGCTFTHKGALKTTRFQMTNVPGLFAAGDCSWDVQLVIVAAAEGARAAFTMNQELTRRALAAEARKVGKDGRPARRPARRERMSA
jgi:thioredoxin reductase